MMVLGWFFKTHNFLVLGTYLVVALLQQRSAQMGNNLAEQQVNNNNNKAITKLLKPKSDQDRQTDRQSG